MDKVKVPETASGVAEAPVDAAKAEIAPAVISAGLSKIRRRRWVVWSVMIIYLPTMWTTQKITHSFNASMPVFFVWFLLLLIAMGYSAVARCPRCGNYYHVNGMILLYLRKCLHCQLPLNEDKTSPKF